MSVTPYKNGGLKKDTPSEINVWNSNTSTSKPITSHQEDIISNDTSIAINEKVIAPKIVCLNLYATLILCLTECWFTTISCLSGPCHFRSYRSHQEMPELHAIRLHCTINYVWKSLYTYSLYCDSMNRTYDLESKMWGNQFHDVPGISLWFPLWV